MGRLLFRVLVYREFKKIFNMIFKEDYSDFCFPQVMNTLSDSNEIRAHNHLITKRTVYQLLNWLSDCKFESRFCHLSFIYRFLHIQATI